MDGTCFNVHTDHTALIQLLTNGGELGDRFSRWLLFFLRIFNET